MMLDRSQNPFFHQQCDQRFQEELVDAQQAEALRGRAPEHRDKRTIIRVFEEYLRDKTTSINSGSVQEDGVNPSFRPYTIHTHYLPCAQPLEKLRRMDIKDLRAEYHNEGRVLLGRIACDPVFSGVNILTVVEDGVGDAHEVMLMNQDINIEASQYLRLGDNVAIKHPFYEIAGGSLSMIRIDHVTDLHIFPADDNRIPPSLKKSIQYDADYWKMNGNEAMKGNDYAGAIRAYTNGISFKRSSFLLTTLDLHRNRAQAYLSAGNYEDCLRDCFSVLRHDHDDEKSLYRSAKAYLCLGRYNKAQTQLNTLIAFHPANASAPVLLSIVDEHLRESSGEYNFTEIFSTPSYRAASYTTAVNVRPVEGAGRGLFALKRFSPGELVLFDNPIATSNPSATSSGHVLMDMQSQTWAQSDGPPLFISIVQTLNKNPSLAASFLKLYAGTYAPVCTPDTRIDGRPVLDTFQIHSIVQKNCGTPTGEQFFVDNTTPDTENKKPAENKKPTGQVVGLWPQASYANHSCAPNATVSFVGTSFILRAVRSISAHEQITISYSVLDHDVRVRQQRLEGTWGFKCGCILCAREITTDVSVLDERNMVFDRHQKTEDKGELHIGDVETSLDFLESSYPLGPQPRLAAAYLSVILMFEVASRPPSIKTNPILLASALAVVKNFGWDITWPSFRHARDTRRPALPTLNRTHAIVPFGFARKIVIALVHIGNGFICEENYQQGKVIHGWAREVFQHVTSDPCGWTAEFERKEEPVVLGNVN